MAKGELQEFRKLIAERTSLQNQIEQLNVQIQHATPSYGAQPRSGKSADVADKIIKLVKLKEDYERKCDDIVSRQIKLEKIIEQLNDVSERTVLRCRYINNMTWEDISFIINYSIQHTFRIHSKAIKNFEKIKDESK